MRDLSLHVHRVAPGKWGVGEATWDTLFRSAPSASPYLATPWVSSWVDTFADSLECVQLTAQAENGQAAGSCLLALKRDTRAALTLRQLYFNTAGEDDADSVVVEYNAPLCAAAQHDTMITVIANHIREQGVDEFYLCGGTEAAVAGFCRALPDWRADVEWRDSPYVDLAALRAAGQGHLDVVSRNTREQIRRSLRKYRERGELTVHVAATGEDATMFFDAMVALHEARWQRAGEQGGFATARRRQFHDLFVGRASASGHVQLLQVRAGRQVLGVLYNLVANGRVCFYQSGLHFEGDNQLKPGLVVHHLAIEHCLAQGYSEYDFLPSGPGDGRYKQSLATSARRVGTLRLQRPGWRRAYFDAARRVNRALRARREEPVS